MAGHFTKSGLTDEDGAAAYLAEEMPPGKAPAARTLRRWRGMFQGPKWRQEGRSIWYYKNDLDEWLLLDNDSEAA